MSIKLGDTEHPANAYEAEMFAAMEQAKEFLLPIYTMMVGDHDYVKTEAKSRGLALALIQLYSLHIVQHGLCCGVPLEVLLEKEPILAEKNVIEFLKENYEELYVQAMQKDAELATKQ